MSLSGTHNKL